MSIPWFGAEAPVDMCVAEVEGDVEAWEVAGTGLAVTGAWLSSEVTCLLGGAFRLDANF